MSATQPLTPPTVSTIVAQQQTAQTDAVVSFAQTGAQLLAGFQAANPALYAQMVGSLSTYSKAAIAPLIGAGLGLVVAHYGIGPYVSPATLSLATNALIALGTGVGAVLMHWWSKRPGRALQAPTAPEPIVLPVSSPTAQEIAAAVVEALKHLEPGHTSTMGSTTK